jgi:hypothetical protein
MRQAELLVFNDIIYAGTIDCTIATFNDVLAQHDMIAVMAVIDNVSTTAVGFDLYVQHSCDGRNWLQRSSAGQSFPPTYPSSFGDLTFASMNPNTTYARVYSDAAWGITKCGASTGVGGGGPMLGHVRLAMQLTAGFAHVKLYAVLRDTTAPGIKIRPRGNHR